MQQASTNVPEYLTLHLMSLKDGLEKYLLVQQLAIQLKVISALICRRTLITGSET